MKSLYFKGLGECGTLCLTHTPPNFSRVNLICVKSLLLSIIASGCFMSSNAIEIMVMWVRASLSPRHHIWECDINTKMSTRLNDEDLKAFYQCLLLNFMVSVAY